MLDLSYRYRQIYVCLTVPTRSIYHRCKKTAWVDCCSNVTKTDGCSECQHAGTCAMNKTNGGMTNTDVVNFEEETCDIATCGKTPLRSGTS